MKRFKCFILTAMIMCLMGTSIINAYEAENPINLIYKRVDSNGDGIEDTISIEYDEAYTMANNIVIPEEIEVQERYTGMQIQRLRNMRKSTIITFQ